MALSRRQKKGSSSIFPTNWDYPNLAKSIAEENVPPALYEKAINAYDGKKYLLLQNQPAQNEDGMDWLYGFYVRKDIADKVGIDPQSVVTKEAFYTFLKAIKDANLQENGQPVFPLGGFSNGWSVGIGNTMFNSGGSYVDKGDGTVEHNFFTKGYEEYTLFYRKLVEEGLMDRKHSPRLTRSPRRKSIRAASPFLPHTIRPFWMPPKNMSLHTLEAITSRSAPWSVRMLNRIALRI